MKKTNIGKKNAGNLTAMLYAAMLVKEDVVADRDDNKVPYVHVWVGLDTYMMIKEDGTVVVAKSKERR